MNCFYPARCRVHWGGDREKRNDTTLKFTLHNRPSFPLIPCYTIVETDAARLKHSVIDGRYSTFRRSHVFVIDYMLSYLTVLLFLR